MTGEKMAVKKQCDRTFTIRLKKSLLRASETLKVFGYIPSWEKTLEILKVPEKGETLLPTMVDLWLTLGKQCLQDLLNNVSSDAYIKHLDEISNQLTLWANKAQKCRADDRK